MRRIESAALAAGALAIPALVLFLHASGGESGHGRRVVYSDMSFVVPEGWRFEIFEHTGRVVSEAGYVEFDRRAGSGAAPSGDVWERVEVDGETGYRAEGLDGMRYARMLVVPGRLNASFWAQTKDLGQALPGFDQVVESIQLL